jgi:aminopeptidase-like protein
VAFLSVMQTSGAEMKALIARLYPICRSITGEGVRETLAILREQIPVEINEVPTGTKVFDWKIPREWNIRDAWIKNAAGERRVDFQKLNLHVVSYSVPVRQRMRLAELKDHLFTVPGHPDWVPYRTSYYKESWGFCLSENQLAQFNDNEEYDVCIDSSLTDGHLTYGEYLLQGETTEEFLFSCHLCHPSLADDNLSGIALAVALARHLAATSHRYSYRFVFVPGSIGAIAWLARNEAQLNRIRHGLVLTCVGDAASITYKRSRQGNSEIDRAFAHVLQHSGVPHHVVDFSPSGYDERQYCSPGINLPVGCMMRSVHGTFPEYHTSADNLEFVREQSLSDSFARCLEVIDLLEHNRVYMNNCPRGEPQLGRRGLYEGLNANEDRRQRELALLWVLNLSDGKHSLLDIAERANLPFAAVSSAADALAGTDLLSIVGP